MTVVNVPLEGHTDLIFTRQIQRSGHSFVDNAADEGSYYQCLMNKLQEIIIKYHSRNDSCLCWFPSFDNVLSVTPNISFDPCASLDQYVCASSVVISDILLNLLEETLHSQDFCVLPQDMTEDLVEVREDRAATLPEGIIGLYLNYRSLKVKVLTQYALMDGFDLISAIGGSMGVFLGWSIMHGVGLIFQGITSLQQKSRVKK